jgi:hypothetical protein
MSALLRERLDFDTLVVLCHCRLHDAFFAAAQEAGLPQNTDFNEWSRAQVRWPPTSPVIKPQQVPQRLTALGVGSFRVALVAHASGPLQLPLLHHHAVDITPPLTQRSC